MKLKTTLVSTALVLASTAALAAPTYHIDNPITGTATFSVSGACKVPMQKYVGAQFGSIKNASNTVLGTGVIDASGSTIVAFQNTALMPGYMKVYQKTSAPAKVDMKLRMSFVDYSYVANTINTMTSGGCAMGSLWTQPTSSYRVVQDMATHTVTLSLQQSFVGDLGPTAPLCPIVNSVQKCKPLQFSGKITFTGKQLIP